MIEQRAALAGIAAEAGVQGMSEPCFINADILAWAEEYDGEPFHALLCDPPYHLTSISTRYKTISERDKQVVNKDPYRRTGRGFMGQQWDGGDIAFRPETWEALARHLHPGAFILAFAGSKGWHRQAVAMEDAGLIIHPTLFRLWGYGSGFPKATRILKGDFEDGETIRRAGKECAVNGAFQGNHPEKIPASEMAKRWQHHRYGQQALKPAVEPVICAQVPYSGKPVACITTTGAGAWNIVLGRIGTESVKTKAGNLFPALYGTFAECAGSEMFGRWPSNLLLDEFSAGELDRMSGITTERRDSKNHGANGNIVYTSHRAGSHTPSYPGTGGASRFFHRSDGRAEIAERLRMEFPLRYCAKAGRRERDSGLTNPARPTGRHQDSFDGGVMLTGAGNERTPSRNGHPTVKPLSLCRYLASLLLPPAEYAPRRILIPFSGSGSEAIGAMLAGWECVFGVEQSAEYVEIARARARFWSANVGLFEEITSEEEEADLREQGQLQFEEIGEDSDGKDDV